MLPLYLLVIGAVGWGVWSLGGPQQVGITNWWSLWLLIPFMMPLWTVGNQRWQDMDAQQQHAAGGAARDPDPAR
jgi:hypothetical protein